MRLIALTLGLLALLTTGAMAGDYYAGVAAFQSKDYYHAYKEWSEAAAKGDARATHRLGMMFEAGKGLPKNERMYTALYMAAAEQNHKGAIRRLKRLANKGNKRAARWVAKNPMKAKAVKTAPSDPKKAEETNQAEEAESTDASLGGLDFLKAFMK